MSFTKKVLKLFFTEKSSDKEYHAVIEASGSGYIVYGLYGKRGSPSSRAGKIATPVTLSRAESEWRALVESKEKKGYTTNVSGTPHAGVSYSSAVTTGAAAPASPPASTTPPKKTVSATVWTATASDEEFEAMLEASDYLVQAVPRLGHRVIVMVSKTSGIVAKSTVTGKDVGLAKALETELKKQAPDTILDGYYDEATGSLEVLDGFLLSKADHEKLPLERRYYDLAALVNKTKKAKMGAIFVTAEDKEQAIGLMLDAGVKEVLLKNAAPASEYQMGKIARTKAGTFVHQIG